MKKLFRIFAASVWMLAVLFLVTPLTVEAENVTSGKLGDKGGILWTYDADIKTLTVTGEDRGELTNESGLSAFLDICADVEHIIVKDCKLYDCSNLFDCLDKVQSIVFDNFDTSQVTNMGSMFSNCSSLESLDISCFDTSQVTNMSYMFNRCNSLKSLDVSGFVTSQVTDMGYMFNGCSSVTSLDVSGFDTSSVRFVGHMFSECRSLKSLDVSGFDTSSFTFMNYMFSRCSNLESLDISGFDISSVYFMGYELEGCDVLTTVKTPKAMLEEQTITLPGTFVDSKGNETTAITKDFCNETLVRKVDTADANLTAFVERMYTVALGRTAEKDGLNFWVNALKSSADGAELAKGFLTSDEFKGKGYNDGKYIEVLYYTFFNRTPEADGVAFWSNVLASGNGREVVLAGFVNSDEFFGLCAEYGISRGYMNGDGSTMNPGIFRFAERLYTKVLKRTGEREGMEYWAVNMASKKCKPEDAAQSFFNSGEYQGKGTSDEVYIRDLYATFMDREADEEGLNHWKKEMINGKGREDILREFALSVEFKGIMESFGL